MREAWSEAAIEREMQRRADIEDAEEAECDSCAFIFDIDELQRDPDTPRSAALYCEECLETERINK